MEARMIEFNGEKRSISGWAKHLGMNQSTLYMRLRRGWSIEKAFTTRPYSVTPGPKAEVFLEFNGERKSVLEWSIETGISKGVIYGRIENDWSAEETLTTPVGSFGRGGIEFNGERKSVSEWSRIIGIPKNTLFSRLRRGWSAERTLTEKNRG